MDRALNYSEDGVIVMRGLVDIGSVERMREEWLRLREHRVVRWNKVEIEVPTDGEIGLFANGYHELRRVARECLAAPVMPYNVRLVVKDQHSPNDVFLHQDSPYHIGSMPKLSAFVALSRVIPENGGMRFWLGTHKYGYLGDAGEINPEILTKKPEIIFPALASGDVVLMNSHLWHESGPNVIGLDRVLVDIIYQREDDPARHLPREGIFRRSRASRLKELQAQVDSIPELLRQAKFVE